MRVAIGKLGIPVGHSIGYSYGYDQLNRIKSMNTWMASQAYATDSVKYRERVSYDPNGNIDKYLRHGNTGARMDSLSYRYYGGTNRLRYVRDSVPVANFTVDIDDQSTFNSGNNYTYDGIGNLISDASKGVTITWNTYKKVIEITRTIPTSTKLLFGYDGQTNRVLKTVIKGTDTTKTYYIRGASGELMSIYTLRKDTITLKEQYVYGSLRLGAQELNQRLTPSVDTSKKWQLRDGQKQYELSNHLGNVFATVNDRKQGFNFTTGAYTYFEAVTINATDYYPFGMAMPSRTFSVVGTSAYRYGFNGMEEDSDYDDDIYSTLFRLYDAKTGRWYSVDPQQQAHPYESPYAAYNNRPITTADPNGDCPSCVTGAIISAALDVIFQVGEHMMAGDNFSTAISRVEVKSVVISAGSGFVSSMFSGGIDKLVSVIGDTRKRKIVEFVLNQASDKIIDYAEQKLRDYFDDPNFSIDRSNLAKKINSAVGFNMLSFTADGGEVSQESTPRVNASK